MVKTQVKCWLCKEKQPHSADVHAMELEAEAKAKAKKPTTE